MIRRAVARAVVAGTVVVLLAGCGAAAPPATPGAGPTASAVSVPAGGVSLADLGFTHGPAAAITVPADVRLGLRVDQPNMVTMTFHAPAAAVIAAWLETHLPDGGFRVTAASAEGVVFEGYAWSGAFTVSAEGSALTLRRPDSP